MVLTQCFCHLNGHDLNLRKHVNEKHGRDHQITVKHQQIHLLGEKVAIIFTTK